MSDLPNLTGKAMWILLQETVADGTIPYYAPPDEKIEDGYAFLFDTKKEALADLWDNWKDEIDRCLERMAEAEEDEEIDEPEFDGWIMPCELFEDGSVLPKDWAMAMSREQIYGFFGMELPK